MHEQIIDALKEQYPRDLRKQVVKSILRNEKSDDKEALKSSYNILNKIFSYIMSELNWSISNNTNDWDETPLKILIEVFPKIETTKWFKDQQLSVSKSIKLEGHFN
ncbi:hypothetical protein SMGD1_2833 [Sulfurimonas gotlandica GD1]|uniref:Uncharacterized protein n=1 Tax=Sulfurimonas gotlandica (strain DSM 19862 / JCM 16533 / GD1) TaxID=929558 RepID=B6BJV5_SULGG|nr:hypothetical protein [Sulfurimonas gotlandica]EDZ62741.1 hypothetical protein CBGD1_2308 [Sulfurimonas gotlandica GD1]EHP31355.1 hypothetical protein SMGD1_2833 [Sulfurimonas gotlandica GD1]